MTRKRRVLPTILPWFDWQLPSKALTVVAAVTAISAPFVAWSKTIGDIADVKSKVDKGKVEREYQGEVLDYNTRILTRVYQALQQSGVRLDPMEPPPRKKE